jgi:YesN/AraC family two-component response regulator
MFHDSRHEQFNTLESLEQRIKDFQDWDDPSLTSRESQWPIALCAYVVIHHSGPEVIKDLTQDWCARQLGISSAMMCKSLKYYFGRTFRHMLNRRKLMIAKDFLINYPQLSIDQIAEKTGYCTGNYFIKAFKKECGVSPYQYRKQLQEVPELKGVIKRLAFELELVMNIMIEDGSGGKIMNAVTIHGGAKKRGRRKRVKFPDSDT